MSLDSAERRAALETTTALTSANTKGGFMGLGLLSTFGGAEAEEPVEKRYGLTRSSSLLHVSFGIL